MENTARFEERIFKLTALDVITALREAPEMLKLEMVAFHPCDRSSPRTSDSRSVFRYTAESNALKVLWIFTLGAALAIWFTIEGRSSCST
jgi:hypothetical protein